MSRIRRDAHTVLLPVAGDLTVPPWLRNLLQAGTRTVVMGESRAEYVARRMTPERRRAESPEVVRAFGAAVVDVAGEPVRIAVDQEPWGITRLHDLVPAFPQAQVLAEMSDDDIDGAAAAVAEAALLVGVDMFLSPVLDVLTGANPWLEGRTLRADHAEVGRIAAAFVRGVQSAGVTAVAKHFPGHPVVEKDPAEHAESRLIAEHSVDEAFAPFRRVIDAGVCAVMTGPVIVDAVDPNEPASTSRLTVDKLRNALGFDGLVVSDDLDTPATILGRPLLTTVLASLEAGVDLLLLPGGPELPELAEQIAEHARGSRTFEVRLAEAAGRVRRVTGA